MFTRTLVRTHYQVVAEVGTSVSQPQLSRCNYYRVVGSKGAWTTTYA